MLEDKIIHIFADNLKRLRKEQGLSQEDLALKSGLHRTYIGGIEAKGRNVSLVNVARIATALAVDISELITE